MRQRWLLVAVSAVQLGLGMVALRVALRDRLPADLRLIRASPDRIPRRSPSSDSPAEPRMSTQPTLRSSCSTYHRNEEPTPGPSALQTV